FTTPIRFTPLSPTRRSSDLDVALGVRSNRMRRVQLVRSGTAFACILRNESAVLVVFHDAGVDVAVGDEDVSLRVPRHVGRARKRSEEHTSELQSRGHLVCRL